LIGAVPKGVDCRAPLRRNSLPAPKFSPPPHSHQQIQTLARFAHRGGRSADSTRFTAATAARGRSKASFEAAGKNAYPETGKPRRTLGTRGLGRQEKQRRVLGRFSSPGAPPAARGPRPEADGTPSAMTVVLRSRLLCPCRGNPGGRGNPRTRKRQLAPPARAPTANTVNHWIPDRTDQGLERDDSCTGSSGLLNVPFGRALDRAAIFELFDRRRLSEGAKTVWAVGGRSGRAPFRPRGTGFFAGRGSRGCPGRVSGIRYRRSSIKAFGRE